MTYRAPATLVTLALVAALAPARPLAAQAQRLESTSNAVFSVRDQSIWNAGPATVIEKNYSIGRAWSLHGGFDAIVGDRCDPVFCIDTRTGFAVNARTSGSIYFNASARVNSGSLDGDVTSRARLQVTRQAPTLAPGDVIAVKGNFGAPRVAFSSEGPSVEARAGVTGSLYVGMSGTGCFIGFGCKSSSSTIVNLPRFDQEIASYNWDESGTVKLFGHDLPGFNFGQPVDIPGVAGGSFTVYTPDLDIGGAVGTYRATGSTRTDVARLDIDPLQLGLSIALPGSECILACSLSLGPVDVGYTLFSASLGAVVGIRQDLTMALAHPFTRYDFNLPTRVRQVGGAWSAPLTSYRLDGWSSDFEAEYVTGPSGIPLAITPTYGLVGSVRNSTFLTVAPSVRVEVLEASAAGFSFGPVYQNEWRFAGLDIPVFNTVFDVPLGTYAGEMLAVGPWPSLASPAPGAPPPPPPFDPWSQAASIPEPGTLALAAGGVLLLAAAARRRAGTA